MAIGPMEESSDGEEIPLPIIEGKKRQRMMGENSLTIFKDLLKNNTNTSASSAGQGSGQQLKHLAGMFVGWGDREL